MQLDDFLTQNDLTENAFAKIIGVAQGTVSRWRLGTRMPRPEFLHKISEATNGRVLAADFLSNQTTKAANQNVEANTRGNRAA